MELLILGAPWHLKAQPQSVRDTLEIMLWWNSSDTWWNSSFGGDCLYRFGDDTFLLKNGDFLLKFVEKCSCFVYIEVAADGSRHTDVVTRPEDLLQYLSQRRRI